MNASAYLACSIFKPRGWGGRCCMTGGNGEPVRVSGMLLRYM